MTVLHTLAIVLGILAVAKGMTGFLWPKGYREHAMRLLESDLILRSMAIFAVVVGVIIVVAVLKGRTWLEFVLFVFAIIYLPLGAMMLWSPDPYRRLATKVLLTGDFALRLWFALGVLIGFLLCLLGLFG